MSQKFENENFPGISGRELVEIFHVLFHVNQYTLFFYKQLSYKQHQVEIGKKASKC